LELVSRILLTYQLNIIQTICSLFGICPFFGGKERTKESRLRNLCPSGSLRINISVVAALPLFSAEILILRQI